MLKLQPYRFLQVVHAGATTVYPCRTTWPRRGGVSCKEDKECLSTSTSRSTSTTSRTTRTSTRLRFRTGKNKHKRQHYIRTTPTQTRSN